MENKLIITVAPSIPPYMAKNIEGLDLSPEGIAAEVVRAWNAGASVVHLHVWDEKGQPTTDLTAFNETIRMIKERCDIIIEGSTGGFNDLASFERAMVLQADIEMASLNLGSVNYDSGVYINSPKDISFWAEEMNRRGIKPDLAVFEAGMVANGNRLIEGGLIDPPFLFSFVLGQQGALPATSKNLLYLSELIPEKSVWGVVGHSGNDLNMAVLSIAMDGHARAGFEDNPYYRPGEVAKSNAQLIERLVRLAKEVGREVVAPSDARMILGIKNNREE